MILTTDSEIEINFQASASQCRYESKTTFLRQLYQDVCRWGGDRIGQAWIYWSTPWITAKCSSIPHFMTEKHSSKCLPPPSIPKTNLNQCHQTSAAACHLCSCYWQFCSRSWWIFARRILVTSMGCEDESNNKCYRRRDLLCYLIQYIILGQFWLNSEGWFLSIQMRSEEQYFSMFNVY